MRFLLKLFFSFIVLMLGGALIVFIKEGRGTDVGVGGPLGIVVAIAMLGGWRAIWKYKDSTEKSSDSTDVLNKE